MFWLYAYGRSVGSLHVLWPQDRKMPYAILKDSVRFVGSCAGTVWVPVNIKRAWKYDYAGTMRARADAINGFGNIRMISRAGPYIAR